MPMLHDVVDFTQPLERRLMIGLQFALVALNDAGPYVTHIPDPRGGGLLSSGAVTARLEVLLREANLRWEERERMTSCFPYPDEPR